MTYLHVLEILAFLASKGQELVELRVREDDLDELSPHLTENNQLKISLPQRDEPETVLSIPFQYKSKTANPNQVDVLSEDRLGFYDHRFSTVDTQIQVMPLLSPKVHPHEAPGPSRSCWELLLED